MADRPTGAGRAATRMACHPEDGRCSCRQDSHTPLAYGHWLVSGYVDRSPSRTHQRCTLIAAGRPRPDAGGSENGFSNPRARGQAVGVVADRPEVRPLAFQVATGLVRYWRQRGMRVAVRGWLLRRAPGGVPAGEPWGRAVVGWACRQRRRAHFSLAYVEPVVPGGCSMPGGPDRFDRLVRVCGWGSSHRGYGPLACEAPRARRSFRIVVRDSGRELWLYEEPTPDVASPRGRREPAPEGDPSEQATSLEELVLRLGCLLVLPVHASGPNGPAAPDPF